MSSLLAKFARWVAAVGLCIGVVIACTCAWLAEQPLSIAVVALLLVVAPLLVSRRFPVAGSWLAVVLLVSSPLAFFLLIFTVADEPVISSYWRCGTGQAMVWVTLMPAAAVLHSIPVCLIWRARQKLARLWGPSYIGALVVAGTLLVPGFVRHIQQGPLVDGASVLQQLPATEIPAAPGSTVVHGDLALQRWIEGRSHELAVGLRSTYEAGGELYRAPHNFDVNAPLRLYRLERWWIIEGTAAHSPSATVRVVFDPAENRFTNLNPSAIAYRFGPRTGPLALLLVALSLVLWSSLAPPKAVLVWHRLGAPLDHRTRHIQEVVAMRITHLAVLVVACVPMAAAAVIGLVF